MAESHRWRHAASPVALAMPSNGAQERSLNLLGGLSPDQAQDILHHRGVTGQCDPASIATREAELLAGHPQELAEDHRVKVRQRDLEPCPVGSVHHAMALVSDRAAALVVLMTTSSGRHLPLQLLRQLSKLFWMDHGRF